MRTGPPTSKKSLDVGDDGKMAGDWLWCSEHLDEVEMWRRRSHVEQPGRKKRSAMN